VDEGLSIAQLEEHLTVEVADIEGPSVRIRLERFFAHGVTAGNIIHMHNNDVFCDVHRQTCKIACDSDSNINIGGVRHMPCGTKECDLPGSNWGPFAC